jgi:hypothetical protein
MPQEPMILVRKPDGTKVKMTLAEFRASKQKQESTRPSSQMAANTSPPLAPVQKNTATAQLKERTWDSDDHVSLMEGAPHDEARMPMVSKDALPMVSVQKEKTRTTTTSTPKPLPVRPTEKSVVNTRSVKPVPEELSRLIESARERPIIQDIRAAERTQIKPARKSMGPVDELGAMNLTDMRRLGGSAEAIQDALIRKFDALKTDAFSQYLEAVHVWEMSPVYKAYAHVLEGALKERRTIMEYADLHKTEGELSAEEVSIVYKVSAQVRF